MQKKPASALAVIICTLAAMFYLYEFILQVAPSVMTNELMQDLNLTAAGLGAMSAFYYYAYTPMQLPAGLLYDRFGPRLLLTIATLICAIGAFFFSYAHNAIFASVGRFLLGIGSAFSFIGALVLVARWFPPKYFALFAGIVQLMSSLGAVVGEAPLAAAVATWGWRSTINYVAIIGIILAILLWLIVRDHPNGSVVNHATDNQEGELKRLVIVCGNTQTWFIGLYTFSVWAPVVIFAALWGVPFLVAVYGLSTTVASAACSMIWLGIGIGSPVMGWWSDHIQRRCSPLTLCALMGLLSVVIVVYSSALPLPILFILLFLFGWAAAGQSLSFGMVKDINHASRAGTAIGFNNMATVAGGALFQPLVGFLLSWHWSGTMQGTVPVYSPADYRIALLVLPFCYVVAGITSKFFLRETYCQHHL